MRYSVGLFIGPLAVCLCLCTDIAHAQKHPTSVELLQRLEHAEQVNSLISADMKPWYLKAAFKRFDNSGKLIDQGTVAEWWIAEDSKRIEVADGGITEVFVYTQGHEFHSAGADGLPDAVDLMLPNLTDPIHPLSRDANPSKLSSTADGCILLDKSDSPVGYCLASQEALQSGTAIGPLVATRSSIKVFQNHFVPAKLDIGDKQGTLYRLQLLNLDIVPATSVNLSNADLFENPDPLVPRDAVLPKRKDIKTPDIPLMDGSSSATDVLRVISARDGHARRVDLIYARNEQFGERVVEAVRKWVHTPAIYAGDPIQQDEMILVNVNRN